MTDHIQAAKTALQRAQGGQLGNMSEAEWHLQYAQAQATLAVADAIRQLLGPNNEGSE